MMMVIAATFFLALSADAAVREIFTLGEATQVIGWIGTEAVVVSYL